MRTMFAAVSHQFVQSIGKGELLAIPSLEDGSKIKMMNVVMKRSKRSFIFWKKVYYIPYDVPLEDILLKRGHLEIKKDTVEIFTTYNKESEFSLSGQFGAGIMDELMDINLKGSDSITVKADLGDITKVNIEPIELVKVLQNRNLDMNHTVVRQICNNKKKVMCVVTGVLSLANDSTISRVDDVDAEADAKANIPIPNETLEASGKFNKENKRGIGLPKGTPLAYKVVELKVSTISGNIEPIIAEDSSGGFYGGSRCSNIDSPDKDIETDGPEGSGSDTTASILQPILNLDPDTRNEIKSIILRMMTVPSDICVMSDLINKVEDDEDLSEGSKTKAYVMDISSLEKNLATDKDLWMKLIEIMGFQLKTDKELSMPESSTPLLNAFGHIFDALAEISANDLDLLRPVSDEARKGLLQLFKFTVHGQPVIELDGETKCVIQDVSGRKLAETIGYKFKETNVTIAYGPEEPSPQLEQIYWVLYALYG